MHEYDPLLIPTEGRRFVPEDVKEGDVYDTLHLGKVMLHNYNSVGLVC